MFFTNSLIKVSQRASLALNSTNVSDMYLYDFDSSEIDVKRLNWAQKAYENFKDFHPLYYGINTQTYSI